MIESPLSLSFYENGVQNIFEVATKTSPLKPLRDFLMKTIHDFPGVIEQFSHGFKPSFPCLLQESVEKSQGNSETLGETVK